MNYPQYPVLSGVLISSVSGLLPDRMMTSIIQEYLSLKAVVNMTYTISTESQYDPHFASNSKSIVSTTHMQETYRPNGQRDFF